MTAAFADLDPEAYPLPQEVDRDVLTPALAIWETHVRHNVDTLVGHLSGDVDRWRPHVKTTKLPRVWTLLFERGVRRFKCATTRELDQLLASARGAGLGRFDVLYAMRAVGPAVERIRGLAASYPEYSVSVLAENARDAVELPSELGFFLDLNPGMDRTGSFKTGEEGLFDALDDAGARFRGLHYYDGHHHESDRAARRRSIHAGYDNLLARIQLAEAHGLEVREVVTSGTPAFLEALAYRGLDDPPKRRHTLSPGTVVFHDLRSQLETPELGLRPAALVLTRALSRPTESRVTFDAGSKALGADADGTVGEVLGRPTWRLARPSEEHLPVDVGRADAEGLELGTLVRVVPRHVCTTVNLHDEALFLEAGGRLATVRISARGHELFPPVTTSFV